MRHGFTTGSCAAAASKAAAIMLLSGNKKNSIEIDTPKGVRYTAEILDISRGTDEVSCAVMKDGGDDPDVTTGALVYAKVSLLRNESNNVGNNVGGNVGDNEGDNGDASAQSRVIITGGKGVGKVTRPGLDQPVGEYAINHVPREMITKEVTEVLDTFDYEGNVMVEISIPDGEKLAEKTFNPALGIEGGISVIGTSGIVEPMSMSAIKETIRISIRQKVALGETDIIMTPGNYGMEFMKEHYGINLEDAVKCSNFIGDSIDMCIEEGVQSVTLAGHIGKLIKVSGGMMNTHSREGDCRMPLFATAMVRCGITGDILNDILDSLTTEEAIEKLLDYAGSDRKAVLKRVMDAIMERIMHYLNKRADSKLTIRCIMYSNQFGLLADSADLNEVN